MVSSCRIGPLPSSSNCSIHTVSSWHFHSSLLQCFPPLLQFQLQHAFLPCAQHHIIREHHLPKVLLFWCFPSVNPSWWQTGKGWKRVLGGGQLPMQRVRLLMRHTSLQLHTDGTFPSPVWCTSLAPLVYHARYEFRCCCLNWSPFFEWSHITPYLPDSIGPWCLVHTCLGNRHYTVHSKDGAVTDGRDIIMQPRIIGPMWRLCHKVH